MLLSQIKWIKCNICPINRNVFMSNRNTFYTRSWHAPFCRLANQIWAHDVIFSSFNKIIVLCCCTGKVLDRAFFCVFFCVFCVSQKYIFQKWVGSKRRVEWVEEKDGSSPLLLLLLRFLPISIVNFHWGLYVWLHLLVIRIICASAKNEPVWLCEVFSFVLSN